MTSRNRVFKRVFDFLLSIILILFFFTPVLILVVITTIDTHLFGVFVQERYGYQGKLFYIYKLRTFDTNKRVSSIGKFLRKYKFDELPQLINVLLGTMSFVGPRPDIKGFMNTLEGDDRILLTVKPGITGPASIKYRNEEDILKNVKNPEKYMKEVIWPDKVLINKNYVSNYSFKSDLRYLLQTIIP